MFRQKKYLNERERKYREISKVANEESVHKEERNAFEIMERWVVLM
jgi:hypothetical protein